MALPDKVRQQQKVRPWKLSPWLVDFTLETNVFQLPQIFHSSDWSPQQPKEAVWNIVLATEQLKNTRVAGFYSNERLKIQIQFQQITLWEIQLVGSLPTGCTIDNPHNQARSIIWRSQRHCDRKKRLLALCTLPLSNLTKWGPCPCRVYVLHETKLTHCGQSPLFVRLVCNSSNFVLQFNRTLIFQSWWSLVLLKSLYVLVWPRGRSKTMKLLRQFIALILF